MDTKREMQQMQRRTCLHTSGRTVLGPGTFAVRLQSVARARPASERVRLAAIGVGGHCHDLIKGFLARDDCEIAALCESLPDATGC